MDVNDRIITRPRPGTAMADPVLRRKAAVGIALGLWLGACASHAATFTVTTTADSGAGSLRQAILDANANPGRDEVQFNIIGPGTPKIQPVTPLPVITNPIGIDGHNQGNPSSRTEINGALVRQGVTVAGQHFVSVLGDFGVDPVSGPLKVLLDAVSPFGGLSRGCDPLPAGSLTGKIALISRGTCAFNDKIQNAQAAGAIGVIVVQRDDVEAPLEMCCGYPGSIPALMVGYQDRAALMAMDGQPATLIPVADGLHLAADSDGSHIRGLVINSFLTGIENSEFSESGIGIRVDSTGNTIKDNFIGTDATGMVALPNANSAVRLRTSGNVVQGNVLSGNAKDGVSLDGGPNEVVDNKIGSNRAGDAALGNGRVGVWLNQAPGSIIRGNVIAANGDAGVLPGILAENGSPGTVIQGNTISGNATHGIQLRSSGNRVGGTEVGQGNVIAFNQLAGLAIHDGAVENVVLGNSIYGNGFLGIDLRGDGITLNDPRDSDEGANHRQNFPVLDAKQSKINPALVIAAGTLRSEPDSDYLVQVFGDDRAAGACFDLPNPFISLAGPAEVYNVAGAVPNIASARAQIAAGKAGTPYHLSSDSVVLWGGWGGIPFTGEPSFSRLWPINNGLVQGVDDYASGVFGTFTVQADANHNGVLGEPVLVTFGLFSDDGSQLVIKGASFLGVGGDPQTTLQAVGADVALTADFFTGNSDSYGTIMLTEGSTYQFEVYQFQGGGGSGLTVAYSMGDRRGDPTMLVPLATPNLLDGFRYTSPECGAQSFFAAEGRHFLGSIAVHTDANGLATFRSILKGAKPAGEIMTATATKMVGGAPIETSEFSASVDVGVGGANAYSNAAGAAGGGKP